jgi:DHA2 family multidrug resistance protein
VTKVLEVPSGSPVSVNPWSAMVVVMIGTVMVVLDSTIVNVALPQIGRDLHAGAGIEWVVSSYLLAVAISQPASGWLADRFGRKVVFLASLASFTVASLLAALAPTLAILVACRVLQGLGGGALLPVGMAMVLELFPRERHGRAMSIYGVAAMVAPAIGPTLGGWLVTAVSWHWLFLINIPIGAVGLGLGLRLLPRLGHQERRRLDVLGLTLGGTGLALVVLGLSEASGWGWGSPSTLACILAGLALLAMFVPHELRSNAPLIDLRIFQRRAFSLAMGAGFFITCAQYTRLVFIPLELEGPRGYSALAVGVLLGPAAVLTAVAMALGGQLVDTIGSRLPVMVGISTMAVALFFMGHLTATTPLWEIGALLAVQGVGMGIGMSPLMVAGMSDLPANQVARGSAVRSLTSQISGAFAIAALGALVSARMGKAATPSHAVASYNSAFIASSLSLLVALVLASQLPSGARRPNQKAAVALAE